jgi:hypothetical protein
MKVALAVWASLVAAAFLFTLHMKKAEDQPIPSLACAYFQIRTVCDLSLMSAPVFHIHPHVRLTAAE